MRVRLAPAFAAAQRALGRERMATAGRPKISMLSPFFRWATVDGMINPWGLEVIVNPEVLPVEQPFVIAHEWGHLAGWARESEASYAGWLTCREGDAAARYSGWLSLYWHLRGALPRDRRTAIEVELQAGPRHDLAAIAARLARAHPLLQQASWRDVRPVPQGQSRGRRGEELRRGRHADPGHGVRRRRPPAPSLDPRLSFPQPVSLPSGAPGAVTR